MRVHVCGVLHGTNIVELYLHEFRTSSIAPKLETPTDNAGCRYLRTGAVLWHAADSFVRSAECCCVTFLGHFNHPIFNTYVGSVASLGSVLIFYVYDAAAGAGC